MFKNIKKPWLKLDKRHSTNLIKKTNAFTFTNNQIFFKLTFRPKIKTKFPQTFPI